MEYVKQPNWMGLPKKNVKMKQRGPFRGWEKWEDPARE